MQVPKARAEPGFAPSGRATAEPATRKMGHTARRISMAARELHLGRRSSQPLLKRERCPGAQPHSRTNEGAIAIPTCPQTSDGGHVRNVAGRRSRVPMDGAATPPPLRSDSHPPLEGGQVPGGQPQSLANVGGFCGQSPLQAAETTCARNSGNGFSVRRARHSSAEPLEPPEPPAQRLWREAP